MARGKRGGYRQPTNPAPVSVPGSGARTDGGPGDRQPLRAATGLPYGERKALIDQQRSAPLATTQSAGNPIPAGGSGQGAMAAGAPGPAPTGPDPFGPSQRPTEPGDFGVANEESMLSAKTMLRIFYQKRPSPWIARLLNDLPD